MVRHTIAKSIYPALRSTVPTQIRALTVTAVRMGEGDTGGVRSGGAASSDAFNKREKANEDLYMKNKEREKLMGLREKIAAQQKHLKELDEHLQELSREEGGEKN